MGNVQDNAARAAENLDFALENIPGNVQDALKAHNKAIKEMKGAADRLAKA